MSGGTVSDALTEAARTHAGRLLMALITPAARYPEPDTKENR